MCGIAGYVGARELAPQAIAGCLALMHRRGPDSAASRHWVCRNGRHVHFLHTRLQIIDLAPRSDQPFQVDASWLAYNGELYNYLELRQELRGRGETFATESDTEVFARLLQRWGWRALARCEGMWALAHYDAVDDSVTLSRDRFGGYARQAKQRLLAEAD